MPALRVILAARDRQRPEVRRRPGEDDQEQQQRMRIGGTGDRRPAEHGRRRAGCTADDDVLRRHVLEPHGVEHRVADQRQERQHGRQRIHQPPQDDHRRDADDPGIRQRLLRGHVTRRDRAVHRARHLLVELAVDDVVDGGGARRGETDAERAVEQGLPGRQARHGEEHAHHRREHDQRDDARLAELVVIAPGRLARCGVCGGAVGHDRGGYPAGSRFYRSAALQRPLSNQSRAESVSAGTGTAAARPSRAPAAPRSRCARWRAAAGTS